MVHHGSLHAPFISRLNYACCFRTGYLRSSPASPNGNDGYLFNLILMDPHIHPNVFKYSGFASEVRADNIFSGGIKLYQNLVEKVKRILKPENLAWICARFITVLK